MLTFYSGLAFTPVAVLGGLWGNPFFEVANIRHLALLKNRNADWAESAIRHPSELSAEEALKEKVINVVADNIPQLLQRLNGMTVEINHIPIVLETKDITIQSIQPNWRYFILSIITNPIVAYILLIFGILGVYFEFLNPGKLFPGVLGVICLLLVFYVYQLLAVNFFGLTLLLAGMTCIIAETVIASFGLLGASGIIGFVLGSMLLLDMNAPIYHLTFSISLLISLASASLFFLISLFYYRHPPRHK